MEMELWRHLKATCESSGIKDIASEAIVKDEDVLFHWSAISHEWGTKEAEALLHYTLRSTG